MSYLINELRLSKDLAAFESVGSFFFDGSNMKHFHNLNKYNIMFTDSILQTHAKHFGENCVVSQGTLTGEAHPSKFQNIYRVY